MFDRNQRGLRGLVKSCTEEITHPGVTDDQGTTYRKFTQNLRRNTIAMAAYWLRVAVIAVALTAHNTYRSMNMTHPVGC
jgi:hypothetical protein